ncbi:hypothetical protein [Limnohabitans planktonicus]|uniref:Prenyltransferase n=1 Tax=Limnohabitans planktonicus II-D5 TaxID=1293045 RepID=A0A2T7UHQ3_9BURK|nr:hypothetical protein [Limnohabitans planktonicus]PVE44151.1 hypothetical protein H663_004170 [Limnohabitans planktonicus II-D5]
MKEIFLGLVPGSVFLYRYTPKFSLGTVSGLFLMEIMPFLIISFIESISLIYVLIGFLLLYSVYDLGYLDNDSKAGQEKIGATIRNQFSKFNYKLFFLIRIPLIAYAFIYVTTMNVAISGLSLGTILAIIPVFILHNRLENRMLRISTFIALNNLKIIARLLLLSPLLGYYLLSAIPHLFIKSLHYMNTKGLIAIDDACIKAITLPIYIGFFCGFIFIDPWLIVVSTPYFINHTKSILFGIILNKSKFFIEKD